MCEILIIGWQEVKKTKQVNKCAYNSRVQFLESEQT